MSDDPKSPDDSVGRAQQIDSFCDTFEAAWKTGQPPNLDEVLAQVAPADHNQLFRELLPIDILYRFKNGDQPQAADYSTRFPALDAVWIEQLIAQQAPQFTAEFQPIFRPDVVIAGRYLLKQKLGEGGMGEVWVAKQTEPVKRNVALKLIKAGIDSRAVLARFEAERQALALMEHPNIARVLDGGLTSSGQPFFVMELVNGLSLNKFCDEAKLTLQQRLELFVPICQAVQHAHHKGIVHRDLKPSNILVTLIDGRPVPKVIDFGVAKATAGKLTDESLETQFGAVVGTLEYMSPEQAGYSGADIDTRADIYSLGVILYELLTGLRPIDAKRLKRAAYTEMIRIIKEEEPSKPSTRLSTNESLPSLAALRQTEPRKLMAVLRGELDWVVMKCLEKDRNRRYETANSLARDIERYLAEEPVEARPPSTTYRLHKFLIRNKGPVLAASLLLLALISGIAGTTWGMVRAERHRILAEGQRALAAQAAIEERKAKEDEAEQRKRADAEAARANAKTQELTKLAEHERKHRELADAALKSETRAGYVASMCLAQAKWEDSRVGQVVYLLESQRPSPGKEDLRGFEWHYWNRLCHSYLVELRHDAPVKSISFSPDGQRLATASADTVKVWDSFTGRELLSLKGTLNKLYGIGQVLCVAFSPDGQRLASASPADDVVRIWDAATGQQLFALQGLRSVYSVAFSPDGNRLASEGDSWNGPRSGFGSKKDLKVWDAATGQELLSLNEPIATGSEVTFSPDGKRLAAATRVWDAATGEELFSLAKHSRQNVAFGTLNPVSTLALSPDGKLLASADRTLTLFDAATGRELLALKGHTDDTKCVAFSPDGQRLASASLDQTVKLWDVATGEVSLTLRGHTGSVENLAFSPDGMRLASASSDGTVKVWNTAATQESVTLKSYGNSFGNSRASFAFSPDGGRVFSAGRMWDAATGQVLFAFKELLPSSPSDKVSGTFSPDGKQLATVTLGASVTSRARQAELSIKIWDAVLGQQLLELIGHTDAVHSVAFTLDGTRLASASRDKTVKFWDLTTGKELMSLQGETDFTLLQSVALSPDGKWLAWAGGAGAVKVWDTFTGQQSLSLKGPQVRSASGTVPVYIVSFSMDGQQLASATADGTIAVWDAVTGQQRLSLKGHTGQVDCVAFTPDGRRLATGSDDHTIKLWDMVTGQELLTLKGHTGRVNNVMFSTDGSRLASKSAADQTIKVWDATPEGQPPAPALVSNVIVTPTRTTGFGSPSPGVARPPQRALALATVSSESGNPPGGAVKSIDDYNETIRLEPSSALNFLNRATAYEGKREFVSAITDYTRAIRIDPKHAQSHNRLSRLLAICSDDKIRDGKKAVEHATTACELTEWTYASFLDTLAAAHAEAGDFEQAIKWATKAIELSTVSYRKDEYKARLELYQSGKPYRQPPAAKP